MALLVAKVPFWEGASKGGFTICDTQKLCSAENTIFIVFSAKHSFAEIKDCKLRNRNLPKIGGCLPTCKKALFFFFFLGGFVFFLCVFVRLFVKRPKKAIFLQFWRLFSILFPKGFFKSFFSSYSVFYPCFPFVFPFKIPFFLCFLSSTPFGKHYCLLLFCLSFLLPFPLLMFACFIETNFPNIPFLKPKLLSFLAVFFPSVVLFLFSWCMFLSFCFYVGFASGKFLFCYYFVFISFLVLLSDYEKYNMFPAILVFLESCWLKGSLFSMLYDLVLGFCFLCCLFAD